MDLINLSRKRFKYYLEKLEIRLEQIKDQREYIEKNCIKHSLHEEEINWCKGCESGIKYAIDLLKLKEKDIEY